MTREEEIDNTSYNYRIDLKSPPFGFEDDDMGKAFIEGAKWADEHPKCPWINTKDDLPCNHEELISNEDKSITFYVIALVHSFVVLSRMEKFEGEWRWATDEPSHWFAIPELPKE